MAKINLPPLEFLRECFSYDPETGAISWRRRPLAHFPDLGTAHAWNERYAGQPALNHDCSGHLKGEVRYEGRRYRLFAHRVAFKLMTGRDPDLVDHKNTIKADNRWTNLRDATVEDNARNRGKVRQNGLPKCVFRVGRRFETRAYGPNRERVRIGAYDTPAEAHAAYCAFVKPIHGAFFNPGAPVQSIFD